MHFICSENLEMLLKTKMLDNARPIKKMKSRDLVFCQSSTLGRVSTTGLNASSKALYRVDYLRVRNLWRLSNPLDSDCYFLLTTQNWQSRLNS